MSSQSVQIAFCAGFIEGEGWFTPPKIKKNGTMASGARVAACQVTAEPLLKLQATFGGNVTTKKAEKHKHPHWQDQYIWQVYGDKAVGIMMTIYGFMSERRKERIRICVDLWREHHLGKPSRHEVVEAIKMYTKEGKSAREIAVSFGVHNCTVYEWLRGDRKNDTPVSTNFPPRRSIDESVVISAIKRVLLGESRINVAKSINEDYYTVAAWLNGKSRKDCLMKAKDDLGISSDE
jgi:hypothetical protein